MPRFRLSPLLVQVINTRLYEGFLQQAQWMPFFFRRKGRRIPRKPLWNHPRKRVSSYYVVLREQLQAVQQSDITDYVWYCRKHITFQPNSLDVFQGHLLALSGRQGDDVHLQSGQSQRRVVLELCAEALQHHVVATLRQSRKHRYTRIPFQQSWN